MIEKGMPVTISIVNEKKYMFWGLLRNCKCFWMINKYKKNIYGDTGYFLASVKAVGLVEG